MKRTLFLLILILFTFANCYPQSEGPFNPMAASYSAAGCLACPGSDWNNFQNISFPDHQYAEAGLAAYPMCFQATCYYSRILYAFDFGFMVPQNATILGVSAQVLRVSTAASGIVDSLVQLFSGSPVGINHASATNWTPNPMSAIYGDSADSWGYILTPDSVNNIQFGLAVMVMNRNLSGLITTASIDHIEMTVYYNTGTGIYSQTRNRGMLRVHYDVGTSILNLFMQQCKISSLQIFNRNGDEIYHSDFPKPPGENIRLKIPSLVHGVYAVVAEADGNQISSQFIVE